MVMVTSMDMMIADDPGIKYPSEEPVEGTFTGADGIPRPAVRMPDGTAHVYGPSLTPQVVERLMMSDGHRRRPGMLMQQAMWHCHVVNGSVEGMAVQTGNPGVVCVTDLPVMVGRDQHPMVWHQVRQALRALTPAAACRPPFSRFTEPFLPPMAHASDHRLDPLDVARAFVAAFRIDVEGWESGDVRTHYDRDSRRWTISVDRDLVEHAGMPCNRYAAIDDTPRGGLAFIPGNPGIV